MLKDSQQYLYHQNQSSEETRRVSSGAGRCREDAVFDLAPFENLPSLSREDAAWLVGMTPEAFDRFMESSGNLERNKPIAILDLLRAGFTLLGRKEAQAAMMGLQLSRALEREKSLATTLQSRVFDEPLNLPVPDTCLTELEPEKKKKKKKKDR
ncbi:MAG: hypothetical protein H7833_15810 [Magnetococcus sp. DMHC-1]|nr:hypothetical protein [Magnetococcales bacterium]